MAGRGAARWRRAARGQGGTRGAGNTRFATATHQAPREWEPGEEGQARTIELTLKLIADVGLVGEPNAGKSTLLSVTSAARPKIADYPFTTLEPNLGVVQLSGHRTFVAADIPGIIEGAHAGKGLGLQFLRHVERTRILAFLVPVDAADPQGVFDRLRAEVAAYSAPLAAKPHFVVLTKGDLLAPGAPLPPVNAPSSLGTIALSSAAGTGLDDFKESCWKSVAEARAAEPAGATTNGTDAEDEGWGEGEDEEAAFRGGKLHAVTPEEEDLLDADEP